MRPSRVRSPNHARSIDHLSTSLDIFRAPHTGLRATVSAEFRERLEWAYDCSLRGVSVHLDGDVPPFARGRDVAAQSCGDRIALSAPATTSAATLRLILAHELAHVAQKRRAGPGANATSMPGMNARLESEAAEASLAALVGIRRPIRLADAPDIPRAWGPAGHYYTTVLVAYAAGMSAERAERLAFYCQMPDQVEQYDATEVGKKLGACLTEVARQTTNDMIMPSRPTGAFAGAMTALAQPLTTSLIATSELARAVTAPRDTLIRMDRALRVEAQLGKSMPAADLDQLLDIQIGLHALSGAPANDETGFRRSVLETFHHRAGWENDLALGLAVHAFGDSFAHRNFGDPTRMYNWGMGHAIETPLFWHDPDDISNSKRTELYVSYALDLYESFRKRYPQQRAPLTETELYETALAPVVKITQPRHQCAFLAGRAIEKGAKVDLRWMFEEANPVLSLEKFKPQQSRITGHTNDHVLKLAREWRMMRQAGAKAFAQSSGSRKVAPR